MRSSAQARATHTPYIMHVITKDGPLSTHTPLLTPHPPPPTTNRDHVVGPEGMFLSPSSWGVNRADTASLQYFCPGTFSAGKYFKAYCKQHIFIKSSPS